MLRAGVTSAFDAATTFNVGAAVRDAIEAGMFEGPRFSVAGRQITSHQGLEDAFPSWNPFPPGQAGVLVKSRDEMIEQVRLQVKDGVDTIKVSGSNDSAVSDEPLDGGAFTEEEFQADRRRSAPPQPDRDGACPVEGIDALVRPVRLRLDHARVVHRR